MTRRWRSPCFGGVAATVAPGFWLDRIKRKRQTKIRRALPDALDVLVVCLQGGLSVMAALSRVASELAVAHPMLAVEIKIAERQMQMGQSKFEMQTMNQSLCDLFLRKIIGYDDAIARSSAPDELNEMIAAKQLHMDKGGSSTGTHGARPQQPPKTQYRNR